MRCPQCGHNNITAFEFCEECLCLLPETSWAKRSGPNTDPFDFVEERVLETMHATAPVLPEHSDSSRFPWSPAQHKIDLLIGRDKELLRARKLLQEVVQNWGSRLVLVLGDRGLGKSTFLNRFRKEAPSIDPDLIWAEAFCRDEPTRPYASMGWLLRNFMKIPPQLDEWMAGERLLHEVQEHFAGDSQPETTEIACLIAFLVGFKIEGSPYLSPNEDDAQTLIPRASQALTRLIAKVAHNQPMVLMIDEAHQASGRMLSLIDLMAEGLSNSPVMILVVGQPDLRNALPDWQTLPTIELKPLSRAATAETLQLLLTGVDNIPKDLSERVIPKAGGNPYAVRAIVRYLHESGAIAPTEGGNRWEIDETVLFDLDIPNTLTGVAHARIQNLEARERQILQQAAVVGTQFWFGQVVMLQRLASGESVQTVDGVGKDQAIYLLKETLDSLVQRELLTHIQDSSLAGETAYGFTSELDRIVLYEQCPARVRHRFHRMIAHWLELQPADYVESRLATIARHLDIGGVSWKAAQYFQRAGQSARAHFNNDEAIRYYEEALRLTGEEELANLQNLLFALGKLYATVGRYEEALSVFSKMLRYAWLVRSRSKGGVALSKLGQVYRSQGDYEAARTHFGKALQLFRSVYDDRGVAGALDDMGQVAWLQGDVAQALVTFEKSKTLRAELRDPRGLSLTLHYIASVYLDEGNYDQAEKCLGDALQIRRSLNDQSGICKSLSNLAVVHWGRGDATEAEQAWRESLDISREIGELPLSANIMCNLAEAIAYRGLWDEADQLLQEGVKIAERAGDRRTLGNLLVNQALTAMSRGEHTMALDCATRALAHAIAIGNKRIEGLAQVCQGDVMVGLSKSVSEATGIEEGLSTIRQGIQTLEESRCEIDEAQARAQMGDVLNKLGRHSASKEALTRAENILKKHGIRPPLKQSLPWTAEDAQVPTDKTPKSAAKKTAAKKSAAKKSTAKKSTGKKSTAKKSTTKKSTAKKSAAKKSGTRKSARP